MLKGIRIASMLLVFALACGLTAKAGAQAVAAPDSGQKPEASSHGSNDLDSYRHSPEAYFRLDFRVLEVSAEGKVVSSRAYSEMVASGLKSERTSSLRTGDRVPVPTSGDQFTYVDTGTKIDVRDAEVDGPILRLNATASVTTQVTTPPATQNRPFLREASWQSYVSVPIGKPAIIFSSDNSADRGKIEIELTAIPLAK